MSPCATRWLGYVHPPRNQRTSGMPVEPPSPRLYVGADTHKAARSGRLREMLAEAK
jgi:hypothetical protein